MTATTYPASVCDCGDCTACEFAMARRLRKARAGDPTGRPARVVEAPAGARATVLRIAAKTRLPIQQVEEALGAGRTEADLMALAG